MALCDSQKESIALVSSSEKGACAPTKIPILPSGISGKSLSTTLLIVLYFGSSLVTKLLEYVVQRLMCTGPACLWVNSRRASLTAVIVCCLSSAE